MNDLDIKRQNIELTFIGSGSAFTKENYHSNILLSVNSRKMLIDCGSDARLALSALGYGYKDIENVFISHVHADHVGGLEWLGFSTKFDPSCKKPELISHINIINRLWSQCLSGGMQSIENENASIDSYFNITSFDKESFRFSRHGIDFTPVRTYHVCHNGHLVDSYGVFFSLNDTKLFVTMDTTLRLDKHEQYYDASDLIFHDCETTKKPSGVHSHYSELVQLPASTKAKMWLYHYNDGPLPDAIKDGFRGFVPRGMKFTF